VRASFGRSYAGQIKIFLVLLVVFLAVAIYFDFHLLVVARNAVQDEAGQRLGVEADLVRAELERDQMLRGLAVERGTPPFVPPTFLDRLARVHGLRRVDLLNLQGRVLSSSQPERVGADDAFLQADGGRETRRLLAGETAVTPLDRAGFLPEASLAAYRPIRDPARDTRAFIRLERDVPLLASVDLDLRTIAALQAGGLAFVLALVVLFARWLLRPYRRLQRAAGLSPTALRADPTASDDADALVAVVQGVLEKMRAQEGEFRALEHGSSPEAGGGMRQASRLLAGMTSAALVFDAAGRLVSSNQAAERLLGVAANDAGRTAADLFAAQPRLAELVGAAVSGGAARSREVVALRGAGGRDSHLGVMLSPIRAAGPDGEAGEVDGAVCLLTDLTEIRSLRERARLRDNLATLGEMSAGIAHEFRNALAVIQGHARLGVRAVAAGSAAHDEAILREVSRLQRVVGDFLRYAKPQTPDLRPLALEALVLDLAQEFRADPLHAGVALRLEGEFPQVTADDTLLRQAVGNLLRNAGEALRDAASRDPVVVLRGVLEKDRALLRLEVEDNGPGIPAEHLTHVFTPFFTTRDGGTGLGLPLVQKVAALHLGMVEAGTRPGGGARIVLTLPLRPDAAASIDLVA
jgi:signal transduction histidine kinase